ncbi:hypothetical protein PFISCL1PPCAC_10168, partial [Pristionchus fissidentatus]
EWMLFLFLIHLSFGRPIDFTSFLLLNSSSSLQLNDTSIDDNLNLTTSTPPNIFDVNRLIRVKSDDWRDEQPKNDIIWSHESRYHPEFGKMVARVGVENDRVGRSSQLMSFVILGTVIGFILYTYLSHVIFVRKLRRELERAQLRNLIHSSALIMAHSANQVRGFNSMGERRRSILNMFRAFKL